MILNPFFDWKRLAWVLIPLCLCLPCMSFAEDAATKARKDVEKAIQIQQKSQADRTAWEQERVKLVQRYEQLTTEKELLETRNQALHQEENRLKQINRDLTRQITASNRIRQELMPFLQTVVQRLELLVMNDAPFLSQERTRRLAALSGIMKDPQVTIAEKYRKVMEALFVEAEYGSTIEVYQDNIMLSDKAAEPTLGNIFRLGRLALFFLSLDQTVCAVFHPGDNLWQPLPESMLPPLRSAVEIGNKRRPAELLSLPVGRLADQGGAQ